ncbi:hypothetical protein N7445_000773 [Penicillium cf. griseofulvum]|nr:hypothetical protein N7445_000773 [Penicillium cf. griseofulvum]
MITCETAKTQIRIIFPDKRRAMSSLATEGTQPNVVIGSSSRNAGTTSTSPTDATPTSPTSAAAAAASSAVITPSTATPSTGATPAAIWGWTS